MSLSNIDDLEPNPILGDWQITYHNQIHTGLKALKAQAIDTDGSSMKIINNQTIAGQKTFNSPPVLPGVEWIDYTNSNFEEDAGWALSSGLREYDDTQSHSGSRCFKMTANGGIVDATSSVAIPVVGGQVYYGEVWVKWADLEFDTGTAISFAATVTRSGGGSNSYPSFWNISAGAIPETKEDWIKLSGTLTVPNDDDVEYMYIRPSVRSGAAAGNVWWDDVRIALVNSTASNTMVSKGHVDLWHEGYESLVVPGEEIELSNQDFELSTGWSTGTGRNYDDTRAYEGTRSFKIVSSGSGADISEVTSGDYIAVSEGEQYYAECYAWWEGIDQPSGTGISLQANITNSGGTQISVLHFKAVPRPEALVDCKGWVKLFGTITMPANAAFLRTRVSIREGAIAGTCWFDRVRVRKLTNQTSLYYRGDKSWRPLNKAAAGLGNLDNTSDINKPISTAQQAALDTKQDYLFSYMEDGSFEKGGLGWTFNNMAISDEESRTGDYSLKYTGGTGLGEAFSNPIPVTDGQVVVASCYIYHPTTGTGQGLRIQAQRIDNNSWTQVAALSASQTLSWENEVANYTVDGDTYDHVRVRMGFNSNYDAYVDDVSVSIDGVSETSFYYRGDKTWQVLTKSAAGLGNVDNTSDLSKPISTAQQDALDLKQNSLGSGETWQYLRGDKTWATLDSSAVSLGNVDNTSDVNKPISTATQAALDAKATTSETMLLSGNQTVNGVKTFSSSPRLTSSSTSGYVWKATSTDGAGSWQAIGTLVTTVDWDNVQNKPSTYPPTIGTDPDEAAAGNHTHSKADIGLGNADNTSDTNKPISSAMSTALAAKVSTSRAINTSSHFNSMGNLSANRTLSIANGGIDVADLNVDSNKIQIAYIQTLKEREVGYGQVPEGLKLQEDITVTSVSYRMGTADASGTTTCELRKNGSTVSGTSGTATTNPTAVNGTWSFSEGDILTVYISAVGTTPGKRLTADILALKS